MSARVLAVIPARYGAQRFPGKPLAMLWVHLAYPMKHGRDFAFALARVKKA